MKPLHLLVGLVSFSSTAYMAARFTVLLYAVRMPVSPAMVGLLAAMFSLVSALASVPTGRLMDRRGIKLPLLVSTGLLGVTVMLGALWRELPALFLIAVVAGLCHSTMVLAFQRLAGELGPPSERPAAFGLLGLGFSISNLAAPVAAGFSIDHAGFMASFVIFGLVPIIPFIFIWQDRLPWPPVAAHHASAEGTSARRRGAMDLLRAPRLGRLYILCGLFESAWMGFGFMLPIYGSELGLDATTIGLIAGAAALAIFTVRLFMARILRYYSPWQLVVAGMVLIGVGYIGFALAGSLFGLAAFAMVIGLGQGLAGPMMNALIYEYSPAHEVGMALGLRTMINNASQAGLPLIAGALGSAIGAGPVFWVMAVMMLGGAWTSRGEWNKGRKHG